MITKYVLLTFFLLPDFASAHLLWEITEQTIPPSVEVKTFTATFKFSNVGKEAIRIGEIKHSCRCVTTVMEKREYNPGEAGQLVMTIDREGRMGNLAESARVKTSDGKETMLVMRIETARFLKVKPGFAIWKRGINEDLLDSIFTKFCIGK